MLWVSDCYSIRNRNIYTLTKNLTIHNNGSFCLRESANRLLQLITTFYTENKSILCLICEVSLKLLCLIICCSEYNKMMKNRLFDTTNHLRGLPRLKDTISLTKNTSSLL
uniref:Uncharacterized protein n=1 Tax=viral metagenome TaxID=1070528 RepID=A0A6C0BJ48_9ZZZZ